MRIEHIRPLMKSQGWDVQWPEDYEGGYLQAVVERNNILECFEVGTGNGFSSVCMSMGGAEVYTFDIRDRAKLWEHGKFGLPEVASRIHFQQIGTPHCFAAMRPGPQEVLFFLDGDKGYKPSCEDFKGLQSVARAGDIIIVLGVLSEKKVARFWRETTIRYPDQTETIKTKNGLGIYRHL